METLYTAQAHTQGGRDGRATAKPEGRLDVPVKPPKELGGPDRTDATNPEELFALGYGACYLSALTAVAGRQKIRAREFTVDSAVQLLKDESDGGFAIGVELHGTFPGVEDEKAAELMRTAHTYCPYSKATHGNIEVKLFVGDTPVG